MYIESFHKVLLIHSADGELSLRMKMAEIMGRLTDFGFIRPHKSYLLNYRSIYSINVDDVRLDDGTLMPLSRRRSKEFKEEYMVLLQENRYIEIEMI